MTNLNNYKIEAKLKALVQRCVLQLNEYSEFGIHFIDPSISELQVLNSINGSLKVVNNELVSKVAMNDLKTTIMDVYNVEISA